MSLVSEDVYSAIESFLALAKQPALVEPGAAPLALTKDCYQLDATGGRVQLHVWTNDLNIVRRITGIGVGKLDLTFERFGKQIGTLELIDLAQPRHHQATRRAARLNYRERFRRSLLRQFPGATICELSSEADLQRSFSPAYSRAMIKSGTTAWAAIGVAPEQADADGALSFGLIWLDYLRHRNQRISVQGLALFVPEGRQRNICLRLLYLASQDVQWAVYVYGEGFEERVDLRDYGNVETILPVKKTSSPLPEWTRLFSHLTGVETISLADGRISWRVNGLEFASFDGIYVRFGIETAHLASASNVSEILALAGELVHRRSVDAIDRRSQLVTRNPEAWLESRVRSRLAELDASLLPAPIYGQVPAVASAERGVLDLLACDYAGRLAVVEVKVSEDLHLPLQALDYWIRVKWHLDRGDFDASGFFPGVSLIRKSPRMLLIAPALNFHSVTESILRYFPADLDVERIGISMDWRRDFKVAFRAKGFESPVGQMWRSDVQGGGG